MVGWEGAALFDPAAHMLEPVMFSTGCWQGYYCAYEVVAQAALQAEPASRGMARSGRRCCAWRRSTSVWQANSGRRPSVAMGRRCSAAHPVYSESDGCFVYDGLAAVVPYSGCLTLGADFVWDQYVHMGFHPPWKYRTVLDLTFAAGRLAEAVDRSEEMARLRAAAGDGSLLSLFKPLEPRP